jgi:hypothetical protein
MKQDEIEHMWKVASNDPNHDTNWHDPVVIAFAKLVAMRTLEGTYDEMIDIVRKDEREACAKLCYELPWKDMTQIPSNLAFAAAIRARGES